MSIITSKLKARPIVQSSDGRRRWTGPGGPASPILAAIGERVGAKLRGAPGVTQMPVKSVELFVRPDFLTPGECQMLVDMIDSDPEPSKLYPGSKDPDFRTSYSCNLDRWHPSVMAIDLKICALMGIEPDHGETMQGQRYQVGQQFKAHHDFFHVSQPYWTEHENGAGQRSWTAMIYLNQPAKGGETAFANANISIAPRTGLLLMWNNCGIDGAPNLDTIHAGTPVIEGTKYIVTKWFRERAWI